jgi:hypothetical protein
MPKPVDQPAVEKLLRALPGGLDLSAILEVYGKDEFSFPNIALSIQLRASGAIHPGRLGRPLKTELATQTEFSARLHDLGASRWSPRLKRSAI